MTSILILPGVGNSGPDHWQTRWQQSNPAYQRVEQEDWDHPVCWEWMQNLEAAVAATGPDTVLVAHSLGCLLAVHWAAQSKLRAAAALLVALPDPDGPFFPREIQGFSPVPMRALPFPSIIVASSNDPYGSRAHAYARARIWGSNVVEIGAAGHINADSGLGDWPAGQAILKSLISPSPARAASARS